MPQKNLTGAKRIRRRRDGAEMLCGIPGGSVRADSKTATALPGLGTRPPPTPPEEGRCLSEPLASFLSWEGSGLGWLVRDGPGSCGICGTSVRRGDALNGSRGGRATASLRSYDSAALTRLLPPAPAVQRTLL